MSETPTPGIYRNMSFDDYAAIDAINNSTLGHFSRSALHAQAYMLNPDHPSDAMELGTAFHAAVLEPDRFDEEFVAAPVCDRRTLAGRERWKAFTDANSGKVVMPKGEADACMRMAQAVRKSDTANTLLRAKGANEVVVIWEDDETGVLCKGRTDGIRILGEYTYLIDIKSTRDASRGEFSKSIFRYGYHRQLAMYLDGLTAVTGDARHRRPVFIAVENIMPHALAVYELEPDSVESGRIEYREFLRKYANCVATGKWPGYADGLQPINVPHWAMKGDV